MGSQSALLVLFILGMTCTIDARNWVVPGFSGAEFLDSTGEGSQNGKVCSMCDEYVTRAFDYLKDNNTQNEIMEVLHVTCSQNPTFKKQCLDIVDYFAPMFFIKLTLIEPEEICSDLDLCKSVAALSSNLHQDNCESCHHTVSELLVKLKDPETELEIIRILLKGCKSIKNYEKQCKKLVFEYGPLILANTEQFLEKTDICVILHACPASPASPAHNTPFQHVSTVADS